MSNTAGGHTAPTHRRTLSGKRVPKEQHILSWSELVRPPKPPTGPRKRTGAFYDAMAALPTPESLAVTEFPEDYRGGRRRRGSSAYVKELHQRLGQTWIARREALHPQRVAERQAARRKAAGIAERDAA